MLKLCPTSSDNNNKHCMELLYNAFKRQTHVHTESLCVGVLKSVILHYDLNVLFNSVIMAENARGVGVRLL